MKKILFLLFFVFVAHITIAQSIYSPNKNIECRIKTSDGKLTYDLYYKGKQVMTNQALSMSFDNNQTIGEGIKKFKLKVEQGVTEFEPVVKVRSAKVKALYTQGSIKFNNYSVEFRVFDDAVAYRFITNFRDKEVKVMNEVVEYNFTSDNAVLFPQEQSFYTHQERQYIHTTVSKIKTGDFCSPPMLVSCDKVHILPTEVDLESYPGVYYAKDADYSFKGIFPHYPKKFDTVSDRDEMVTERENYLAITKGRRSYPWRVAVVTDNDKEILSTVTLAALAAPCKIENTSWIKPGKVAWDWYNANNLAGVDFEAGVNTQTYKYFIDFAANNSLEYVILDEGWYDIKKGFFSIVPDIDLKEIIEYGKSKNVGIILWTTWLALDKEKDTAFDVVKEWGVKGLKIDFMQRDDQIMVDWYIDMLERAADKELLVDFHGSYKPTGLTYTYPNMLTSEGVYGGEQNKWTKDYSNSPEHNVILPFIRMLAGPMDFTPGAMRNAHKDEYIARWNRPMSIGTRCHQLGMYVIYESPLQMLCDRPTDYEKEPNIMKFLSEVPSVWDETVVLDAKVADYAVMARRLGNKWWIGAMTDYTAREIEITLDFLAANKTYTITLWEDGVNVERDAEDYTMRELKVKKGDKLSLKLYSGGGFAAVLKESVN